MNFQKLVILLLTLVSIAGYSQDHFIKADFSYFATRNPVFKLGYEYAPDSSQLTFGGHFELGRYASNTKSVKFSSINDYELSGYGLLLESKYFLIPEKDEKHYGGFVSVFALGRKLSERYINNIEVNEDGYNLSEMNTQSQRGIALNYGLAMGYRSGCYAGPLHFEVLAGYAFGINDLNEDNSGYRTRAMDFVTSGDYLRVELNIVIEIQ